MFAISEAPQTTPERKLLVAMIERAVFDYFGNQQLEKDEASDWLFSDDEDTEFSFLWVCSELDLDAASVLARVQKMTPRHAMSTQKWWVEQGLRSGTHG